MLADELVISNAEHEIVQLTLARPIEGQLVAIEVD